MKKAAEQVQLVAVHGVRLDGKRIAPGKPFTADLDTAAQLIIEGAATEDDGDTLAPAEQPEGSDARLAAIVAAGRQLTTEDFTAAGPPKVAAVSKLVGFTVTAKEIDEAAAIARRQYAEGQNG